MRKLILTLLIGLFPITIVTADEVILSDGSRFLGEVISKTEDTLVFETTHAGTVEVDWTAVTSLTTENPVRLTLTTDARQEVNGALSMQQGGGLEIRSGTFTLSAVPLDNVVDINRKAFTAQMNVGGMMARGNTQREELHLDAELVNRGYEHKFTVGGSYNYSADSDGASDDNALAYVNYSQYLDPKWYLYVHGLFYRDKFQDLNLRTSLGVGLGYQFWENDNSNFSIEFGPDYVNEDYISTSANKAFDETIEFINSDDDGEDRTFIAGRWLAKYDKWFFDDLMQLFVVNEGIASLEDVSDVFIRTRQGLRFSTDLGVQLTTELDLDYDNIPAFGRKKVDTRYIISLGYRW